MKHLAKVKKECFAIVFIFIVLLFTGPILRKFQISDGRKALPLSATNVEENIRHGFSGSGFCRLLKANLPEEDYAKYAKSLGLSKKDNLQIDQKIGSVINAQSTGSSDWSIPPEANSTTYLHHTKGSEHLRILRYHSGIAYYLELSW